MVILWLFPMVNFFSQKWRYHVAFLQRGQGHHVLDELIKLSDGDPSNLELSGISEDTRFGAVWFGGKKGDEAVCSG